MGVRIAAARRIASLWLVAAASSCAAEDGAPVEPTPTETEGCVLQPPRVAAQWLSDAGGHELWVRVGCQQAELAPADTEPPELLATEGDARFDAIAERANIGPGLTLLVLRPAANGDTTSLRALASQLILDRPPSERIAIFAWGQSLVQLSDFRTSRATLASLLDRVERVPRTGDFAPAVDTLRTLAAVARSTGAPAARGLRSVVVASELALDPSDIAEATGGEASVEFAWIMPGQAPMGHAAIDWTEGSDSGELARLASDRLDAVAERGFVHVGLCPTDLAAPLAAQLTSGEAALSLELVAGAAPTDARGCDPRTVLEGTRLPVDTVDIHLDDQGRAEYQARLDELDRVAADYDLTTPLGQLRLITEGYGTAKTEFAAALSLAPGPSRLPAMVHLRGQGAAFCARHSFTANLDGPEPRYLSSDAATDQMYMIAGCEDPGLYAFVGDSVYADQGLFPSRFHYVELRLDGVTQGAYTLMEQREQKLKSSHARLRGTVRRRYEQFVEPDVDSVIGHDQALREAYDALVGLGVPEDEYAAYLDARLDVDGFLRWIAVNSVLMNSDSLDEVLFVSTESLSEAGVAGDYFHVMGWDPQTIFLPCDEAPPQLVVDPDGLSYCQTGALEARVLGNPELYGRYVAVLGDVLDRTDESFVATIVTRAIAQLEDILAREGVAAAMDITVPAAPSPWQGVTDSAMAAAHLDAVETEALDRFRSRRTALKAILDGLPGN